MSQPESKWCKHAEPINAGRASFTARRVYVQKYYGVITEQIEQIELNNTPQLSIQAVSHIPIHFLSSLES